VKEVKSVNEKRQKVKAQLKKLNQVIAALEKQLRIARKAYENV
jgi:septal ring factor EnvC (AmiA/AmiB activator)